MTPAALRALADEVEKLDGPGALNLELEMEIAMRCDHGRPAAYTSSLDAAASVMPDECTCRVLPQSTGTVYAIAVDQDGYERDQAVAATEALARLACGLRARAAMMERETAP